jgi:hypothetical protein
MIAPRAPQSFRGAFILRLRTCFPLLAGPCAPDTNNTYIVTARATDAKTNTAGPHRHREEVLEGLPGKAQFQGAVRVRQRLQRRRIQPLALVLARQGERERQREDLGSGVPQPSAAPCARRFLRAAERASGRGAVGTTVPRIAVGMTASSPRAQCGRSGAPTPSCC